MSADEAARAREEWLVQRVRDARKERDQYRGWFDRLLVIVNAYETSPQGYSAELDRLRADRDRSGAFGVLASDG